MISGFVSKGLEAILSLVVSGSQDRQLTIQAVLDRVSTDPCFWRPR